MEGLGKWEINTESTVTNGNVTLTNDRPVLSSERAPHTDRIVIFKQEEISGHEPQMGLDTEAD
jgi:hypothetical protein